MMGMRLGDGGTEIEVWGGEGAGFSGAVVAAAVL